MAVVSRRGVSAGALFVCSIIKHSPIISLKHMSLSSIVRAFINAYGVRGWLASINVLSHHEKLLVDYHLFVESFSLRFTFTLSRASGRKKARMYATHNRMLNKTIFATFSLRMYTALQSRRILFRSCSENTHFCAAFDVRAGMVKLNTIMHQLRTLFKTIEYSCNYFRLFYYTTVNRWKNGRRMENRSFFSDPRILFSSHPLSWIQK